MQKREERSSLNSILNMSKDTASFSLMGEGGKQGESIDISIGETICFYLDVFPT